MASLMDSIMGQLGGGVMKQLSGQLGTDEKTTGAATGAALTTLLGAISRNAAQPGGAESLNNALAKDHDGGLLDNVGSFLGNAEQGPGNGILKHVLGGKRRTVERNLGRATGMDQNAMGKLMATLAPIVMAQLGKQQRSQGLNAASLAGMLGQERQAIEKQQPAAAGILGSLLDTDGDGDVDMGDLAKHGSGLLGKLFS